MDFINLFTRILELSPFVATLFYFLYKVWEWMQKKDEALTATMKEHSVSMLQMQEKSIVAQNNQADATRQLAGVMTDFKEHISEKIDDLKPARNGTVRRLPVTPTPTASITA